MSYTGDFYGLGHASRFVHPGARRIGSDSFGTTDLETVAFENVDGSVALLALNNRKDTAIFSVVWHDRAIRVTLAPGSLETFTWAGQ